MQRKPLNAAKHTEHSQEYGARLLRLSSIIYKIYRMQNLGRHFCKFCKLAEFCKFYELADFCKIDVC